MTKQEINKWIVENCTKINEYGIKYIDLNDLKFDCDVHISRMIVNGGLDQSNQNVEGDLHQDNQKVKGDLCQFNQKVKGYLWQDYQRNRKNRKRLFESIFRLIKRN